MQSRRSARPAARSASATAAVASAPVALSAKWRAEKGTWRPRMFSTMPSTRRPVFLQKLISLRTSAMATSCGVVTTTAPSTPQPLRYWITDRCSSEVPGGAARGWEVVVRGRGRGDAYRILLVSGVSGCSVTHESKRE